MAIRDLMPWTGNRSRELDFRRNEVSMHPFFALHREMNRMFDDIFRGFELAPLASGSVFDRTGWPRIDVDQDDKVVKVTAELPGLEEKDVTVEVADGVLTIAGEKKSESGDNRVVGERFYGRFERRLSLDGIDEDKTSASFKNGVLTVTLPKADQAKSNVKRIAVNATPEN